MSRMRRTRNTSRKFWGNNSNSKQKTVDISPEKSDSWIPSNGRLELLEHEIMLKKPYLVKFHRNSSINELLDPFQSVIAFFYVNMPVYQSLFLYKLFSSTNPDSCLDCIISSLYGLDFILHILFEGISIKRCRFRKIYLYAVDFIDDSFSISYRYIEDMASL